MTIQELKDYRKLQYTIRYWRKELEDMQRNSYTRSPQLTGLPGSGELSDPTSERAVKENKIMERIQRLELEQSREAERIMAWIQNIDDPMIQVIMHARYIKGKSWVAVSVAAGGNNSPDSVRMAHNRYLFALFGHK